ncbi:unnamed protein product [Effrenium voratum]|nr:unnamed protein product [Effrenium voratum]
MWQGYEPGLLCSSFPGLREVLAEGFSGRAAKLGPRSIWASEADFAVQESRAEEQAAAAWSEALSLQLAAKQQQQRLAELELQEQLRVERSEALKLEKQQVVVEEEAQQRAREKFRKES